MSQTSLSYRVSYNALTRQYRVALGSGLLSFAALGFGVYLGHFCDRWLAGTAVAALGVIVFFVAMILGSLLFTNVHWQ